jgi:starvation-inducible DNA-binding protein
MRDPQARRKQAMNVQDAKALRKAPLGTPTDLKSSAVRDISGALTTLLADMFALYMKTKNFHWHMSGPHFRDYHLLLDEHAEQIFATTDAIAERVRKIGGTTLRSIGHVSRLQRILDNDADFVTPLDMLAELRDETSSWRRACARRTVFAMRAETSPARACWRPGSTRPKDAPGSCSRRRGPASLPADPEAEQPRRVRDSARPSFRRMVIDDERAGKT